MKLGVRRAACAITLCILSSACDDKPTAETETPETSAAQSPVVPEVAAAKPPAKPLDGFVAHEWGLVRYGDSAPELATSYHGSHVPKPAANSKPTTNSKPKPKPPRRDDIRRRPKKPLIYLRPDAGFDTTTSIDVSVTMTSGALREVWPTPAAAAQPKHTASYAWTGVTLQRGTSCGKELAPKLTDPACASLTDGGVCEAAEFAEYLSPVSDCLSIGDLTTPVLIYNGELAPSPPPLTLTDTDVSNTSAHSVGPVYVNTTGALYRIAEIPAGATLPLTGQIELVTKGDAPIESIRGDLVALGLSAAEANDFIAAWKPDVLKQPFSFKVLGFYSKAGVDSVARLEITPKPRELVRVLAFSVDATR